MKVSSLKLLLIYLMMQISMQSWACTSSDFNNAQLIELKKYQWSVEDSIIRQNLAVNLLPCLSDPNPQLRDEIAFEALSYWMRHQQLDKVTLHKIRTFLLEKLQINQNDSSEADGFEKPFAALVLAEIARVDRIQGLLSEKERQEMVDVAVNYLSNIQDYRGYDEIHGWRHGVAHAADWMMQLSLNPALNGDQFHSMLKALAIQIKTHQHFYHYGESERLLRPVLFIAMNSNISHEQWSIWFDRLLVSDFDSKLVNQASLARQHNLSQFLTMFYMQLQESNNDKLKTILLPLVQQASKNLH